MTFTHEQVLAAIDQARPSYRNAFDDRLEAVVALNAHCDDLRATAERHAPLDTGYESPACADHYVKRYDVGPAWPCEDYRQVIDRLTTWGVL